MQELHRFPIAISGIGCRMPGGVESPAALWRNLCEGVDAIAPIPADRWNVDAFYSPDIASPGRSVSRFGGFIDNIDRFDSRFFGVSPREALRIDPQQRLLLQATWEAFEDAGIAIDQLEDSDTGVFIGISYCDFAAMQGRDLDAADGHAGTGSGMSLTANRISHRFGFHGPSVAVDTACSSSLVAIDLACHSIWTGQAGAAVAGGVNLILSPETSVFLSKGAMLSPDGRCHSFDARANGYVRGEGVGVLVLKPLSAALEDGNRIYAVIRATATNQDGHTPSVTQPDRDAQVAVIREACRRAQISPAEISYVEAHGTGTPVGDPIEVSAIATAISRKSSPITVGSVKTNLGHLESASGVAGLIKAALSISHGRIPGNLHFETPNPEIDFAGLNVRVPRESVDWRAEADELIAGVNSFGFGGTNAHVIVSEVPGGHAAGAPEPTAPGTGMLFPISANSEAALRAVAQRLHDALADSTAPAADVAGTLALRRSHLEYRALFEDETLDGLREQLQAFVEGGSSATTGRADPNPGAVFVFVGQGTQWHGMARDLLDSEPVFRHTIETIDHLFRQSGGFSIAASLSGETDENDLHRTEVSQPLIFAVQVALAELWKSWGIEPDAVIGHSVGEVAAACVSGALSLDDAVVVIRHRSRLQQGLHGKGQMLVVTMPLSEVETLLEGSPVEVAAVNSSTAITLAGEQSDLDEIQATLEARKVACRYINTEYAFHSRQMDPLRDELIRCLQGIESRQPAIPMMSTVNADYVKPGDLGPEYWWRNVRQVVQFASGTDQLIDAGHTLFVEVGPHSALAGSLIESLDEMETPGTILQSMSRGEPGSRTMRRALRTLYARGLRLDWRTLNPPSAAMVELPTYPWENESYWLEGEHSRAFRFREIVHPLLGERSGTAATAWTSAISLRSHPYLVDHNLAGDAVFPGAGYIEILLAAGRELFGDETFEVNDLHFPETLYVEAERSEQFETRYDASRSVAEIHTRRAGGEDEWTLKAGAELRRAPAHGADDGAPDAAFAAQETVDHERFYQILSDEHGDFGPTFQGVQRLMLAPGEARADIELPEGVSDAELAQYVFHPALLDACIQCARGTMSFEPCQVVINQIPVFVRRVTVHKAPTRRLAVRIRTNIATDQVLRIDLEIRDDAGALVALLEDLEYIRIKRISEASVTRKLYRTDWHPRQLTDEDSAELEPGTWIVFADEGGIAARLADELGALDCHCVLATHADEFMPRDGGFAMRSDDKDDMRRVLDQALAAGQPVRGIVHCWSLDVASPADMTPAELLAGQALGSVSVLHLVQEAIATGMLDRDDPPELLIVTRGAHDPDGYSGTTQPLASVTWGLGRVVSNELVNFRCRSVDLDPEYVGVEPILAELRSKDPEPEAAWRGEQRFVNRLVSQRRDQLPPRRHPATTENGTRPFRVEMYSPGSLARIRPREMATAVPGPGRIGVRVEMAGLNFRDVMAALGLLPDKAEVGPAWQALGLECVGVVETVGEGVSDFRPGDRVLVMERGAFASRMVVDAGHASPVPARLTSAEAATVPVAFSTAWVALVYLAGIGPDDKVLVHCATGGVGLAAVQICQWRGAEIFATAGSDEKRDYLRSLGIKHVMDSRTLDFAAEIRRITGGRGVDVVLNSLSGDFLQHSLDVLAPLGRFLEIGKRDIYANSALGMKAFSRSIRFYGIDCARIFREQPDLARRVMHELEVLFEDGHLQPLPLKTYKVSDAEQAFRDMSQARHIGKLVLDFDDPELQIAGSESFTPVAADGAYLVAGGTSGFGLRVANWLAQQGAGHLVLASRSGEIRESDAETFAMLEASAAGVEVVACDLARYEDVRELVARIEDSGRPLRGVLNAAALFDDAVVFNMDRASFDNVLAPKVAGSWNLHLATRHLPLDLFVLFSSLSADLGTPGQSNYAAANAFLNGLARYRRAEGIPALAINFGALAETGFISRNRDVSRLLGNLGVEELDIDSALESLGLLLASDVTEMTVASINWARLSASSADVPLRHRLSLLLESHLDAASDHRHRIMQELGAVAPEQAVSILETFLRHEVARILGVRFDAVEPDRPLHDLGLDSLAVFELKNSLEFQGFLKIPVSKLKANPTISNIARLVLEFIHETDEATGEDAEQQHAG